MNIPALEQEISDTCDAGRARRVSPWRRASFTGLLLLIAAMAHGQPQRPASPPQATSTTDVVEAGESDAEEPRRRLVKWNEYEGPFFTIRFSGGVLFDYAAFSQDEASREQVDVTSHGGFRDARVLLKGRLKFKRPVTWSSGIMYDGATDKWLVRETGIMIAVPEIFGHVFIGRTKEGFSLNKVMTGYAGWTMERATINDATIPILADGVKWLGYLPKTRLLWNLGFYGDWLSEGQSFSTYRRQVAGRVAWLPVMAEDTLLHVGMSVRYGKPKDDELRLRSRPEAFLAPYFIDTSTFGADSTTMIASEIYYRPGPVLLGSEYFVQKARTTDMGEAWFHGGDVVASWLVTGETRVYNTRGGYFGLVSPARTVFQGGPGAWEVVGRFSYSDLDSGSIRAAGSGG